MITTDDTQVGMDEVAGLAASGNVSESVELSAPSSAGPYYYGACVDAVTDETNTENNCSQAVEVTVLETQQQQGQTTPDLVVESPSVSDDSLVAGAGFSFSVAVRNTGAGASPATTLRYYRSADDMITTDDTQVGMDEVAGLAASGNVSESVELSAPSSAGPYYYGACVDAVTDETNTENNCSQAVEVTVLETQQQQGQTTPDLVVESPSVSDDSLVAGAAFSFSVAVRNAGRFWAHRTTLRYYGSPDATITTEDTPVATAPVRSLVVGLTFHAAFLLSAPTSVGPYYYGACVDAVTDETSTANNCSSGIRVQVRGEQTQPENNPWADVSVRVQVTAVYVEPGETFSMNVDMITGSAATPTKNLSLYRSADTTITRSDTGAGTVEMEKILPSSWRRKSITQTAPSAPGTYYYGACVDAVLVPDDPNSTIACSSVSEHWSSSVQVLIAGTSDLIVSNIGWSAGLLVARVRNDGTGESFPTRLWFYRSRNASVSASDDARLDASWAVRVVQPNTTYYRQLTHRLQPPTEPGTYYYWACVAAARGETDATNNCSIAVEYMVVTD